MTVIAWNGKTLAADRMATCGSTKGSTIKIFRVKGELVAFAGRLGHGAAMLDWYRAGADSERWPKEVNDATFVVIRPDGTVREYDSHPTPFQIVDEHCAWGTGDAAAKAAMACGADAKNAVLIASRFVQGCGNGVDTLEFE